MRDLINRVRTLVQTHASLRNEVAILRRENRGLDRKLRTAWIARAQVNEARRAAQAEAREVDRLRRVVEEQRAVIRWLDERRSGGL